MNILFLAKASWDEQTGGIEKVTICLARYFAEVGHNIFFVNDPFGQSFVKRKLNLPGIHYTLPYCIEDNVNNANVEALKKFIKEHSITHIINQNGDQIAVVNLVNKVKKDFSNLKSIICSHLDLFHYQSKKGLIKNRIWRWVKSVKYNKQHHQFINKIISNLKTSDLFIPLANVYTDYIKSQIDSSIRDKVVTIYNPSPKSKSPDIINKKKNIILFVGRLTQIKQPQLALSIWEKVAPLLPDWEMKILGDGMLKSKLETTIAKHHIPNVSLLGWQDAEKYMEEASILLSTSKTEGYSLVTTEAMANGVIPMSFEYTPTKEIIDDDISGLIISRNISKSAKQLFNLCTDETKRKQIALNAINKSKERSIEIIGKQWIDILSKI